MEETYSQCGQDLYALEKTNNISNGYYIDIGAFDPYDISNSLLLEKRGWNGLSFEAANIESKWKAARRNKLIRCDATRFNFEKCFAENNVPKKIDYLSLDIDGATLDCLRILPLNDYVFRVITIEHDEYSRGRWMKDAQREWLLKYGYKLDRPDVAYYGNVYEDWWLHD